MAVVLPSGYTLRVARECFPSSGDSGEPFVQGNLILTGDDGHTSEDFISIDPKSALELAAELIRSAIFGMVK